MRKELGGGSYEDIGAPLALWKAGRDYQSVIEETGLPLALQRVLARFGAQARVAALQAEVKRLQAGAPMPSAEPTPAPAPRDPPTAEAAFIGILMSQALARKSDAFWGKG